MTVRLNVATSWLDYVMVTIIFIMGFLQSYLIDTYCVSKYDGIHTYLLKSRFQECFVSQHMYFFIKMINWVCYLLIGLLTIRALMLIFKKIKNTLINLK